MQETKTFSRSDYMRGLCSHRQYYAQFVTPYIKGSVRDVIGLDRLMSSTDEHLNDIPLHRWDRLSGALRVVLSIPNEYGDGKRYYSLGGGVCILKEAARQIIEEQEA